MTSRSCWAWIVDGAAVAFADEPEAARAAADEATDGQAGDGFAARVVIDAPSGRAEEAWRAVAEGAGLALARVA